MSMHDCPAHSEMAQQMNQPQHYHDIAGMIDHALLMPTLTADDIDAGIGHFANTQITVNNQVGCGVVV